METKELKKQLREMIKQEEKNNALREQKKLEFQELCKRGSSWRGPRYEAYKAKWKDLPRAEHFSLWPGINPVAYGGRCIDKLTALHCVLAYLRGKQHMRRVRVTGFTGDGYYKSDGVMFVVDVQPDMYKQLCEHLLDKFFPKPTKEEVEAKKSSESALRFTAWLEKNWQSLPKIVGG